MPVTETTSDLGRIRELLPPDFPISDCQELVLNSNNMVTGIVPTDCIINTDQAKDKSNLAHLDGLMDEMKALGNGFEGQTSAITTGFISDRGREHEIADGFHRHELQSLRTGRVWAGMIINITEMEMLTQRIGATFTHKSLHYARIVNWANKFWDDSPWAELEGVTVIDAFALTLDDGKVRRGSNLDPQTAKDIRQWALTLSADWAHKPDDIVKYLRSSDGLDPVIIERIRQGQGSYFTVEKAQALAEAFTGEIEFQIVLADAIEENGYTFEQTQLLIDSVGSANSVEQAIAAVQSAQLYLPKAINAKKAGSGGSSKSKPSVGHGLPRMRTPDELLDELHTRLPEVLRHANWTRGRLSTAALVIKGLNSVLDKHSQDSEGLSGDTTEAQFIDIETIVGTPIERSTIFRAMVMDFLNGSVDECPNFPEIWQRDAVKASVRLIHQQSVKAPITMTRLGQINERLAAPPTGRIY